MTAELVESLEIGFDVVERPLNLRNRFAEVEQIGTVRDDMLDVVVFAVIFEIFGIIRVDGFDLAAAWGFGKNLHGVAAILFAGFLCGLGKSSSNRHVSTKNEHGFLLRDSARDVYPTNLTCWCIAM
ncbi:MAG TPA: hypothetical protein PKA32_02150 [Candidatus Gracilibacteria bacterium]|nr:hypothetical protein [Candidatus Gracilibacteria bacterium]